MAFIDFISKEDYQLVNEAFTRSRKCVKTHQERSALAKKWHKHYSVDDEFYKEFEWIKKTKGTHLRSLSYKDFACFSKNSDVLCNELQNRLSDASCVIFSTICFKFLLNYHYPTEECQVYMLSAFKFLLKILELTGVATILRHDQFSDYPHYKSTPERMWHYLKVVKHLELPEIVSVWILHVFSKDKICLKDCFYNETNMKTVLKICRKQKIDVFGLFKENTCIEGVNGITNFSYGKLKNMLCLLLMGVRNNYSKEACEQLRRHLTFRIPRHQIREDRVEEALVMNYAMIAGAERPDVDMRIQLQELSQRFDPVRENIRGIEYDYSREPNKIKFRCYQALNLHLIEEKRNAVSYNPLEFKRESIPGGLVLKVLWGTITDSFLTKEDFQLISWEFGEKKINHCFEWYENLVTRGRIQVKEPRSLKHLARCSIRQRLAENFSLLEGTDQLPLPQKLVSYLNVLNEPKNLMYIAKCVIRKILSQNSTFPLGIELLPHMNSHLINFLASMDDPFKMYY